jgi:uncharacterized membrane protein YhhN
LKRALPFTLAVALYCAAKAAHAPSALVVAKPLPVLALAWAVMGHGARGRRLGVLTGLLFSAAGDVLLEVGRFLPGLVAFLLAHVAYTAAFLSDMKKPALFRALPFAVWGALLFDHVRPGLGALAGPVAVYVVAISTMMWRAAARVREQPPGGAWAGLLGAVSFGLSDSLIALDRFASPIPWASVPIMLFYFLGQAGIAMSALDKETP